MEISNEKILECNKKLMLSRMRILMKHGFYGLLLMHMTFALDEKCESVDTNGKKIYFNPEHLLKISNDELDFVLMHEILHVVLRHCKRKGKRKETIYDLACDIVVNSNIYCSSDTAERAIIDKIISEEVRKSPTGEEGYRYTAEELYEIMYIQVAGFGDGDSDEYEYDSEAESDSDDKEYHKGKGNGSGDNQNENKGHVKKQNDLPQYGKDNEDDIKNGGSDNENNKRKNNGQFNKLDDHSRWGEDETEEDEDYEDELWNQRVMDAVESIKIKEKTNQRGNIPLFAERIYEELKNPQIDWKTILADFISEEVCDYSFSPPDRRFDDSPFFLPDFNDTEIAVRDILFMIDTSGSMSDEMITAAYSEVKGAIDQFDGRLKGWLGFFDADVVEPKEFENEDELKVIKAKGGGGTSFHVIFQYVNQEMSDNPPASIIILTDGYAPFPNQSVAGDIPVLWLLNNEEVNPPWGKIARIKV